MFSSAKLSGQYVVPRSSGDWVYDVLIKDNNWNDICTVGFTKTQIKGAIFFNNFLDNKYYHQQDEIKRIAKDYALSHGVSW